MTIVIVNDPLVQTLPATDIETVTISQPAVSAEPVQESVTVFAVRETIAVVEAVDVVSDPIETSEQVVTDETTEATADPDILTTESVC